MGKPTHGAPACVASTKRLCSHPAPVWQDLRGGIDFLPGAIGHCAGPFLVPARQSSPSLAQLSALRQGRPTGPAALREQRVPRCPRRCSEQPHALQQSLEERKKQASLEQEHLARLRRTQR